MGFLPQGERAAYASIKGPLGHRVLAPQRQKRQNISQFLSQQQRLWNHWMERLTPAEISAKGSMIQAEMLLPQACRTQLQMSKPKTITEMVSEVEQFFAVLGMTKWSWGTYQPGSDNSRMKEDKATTPSIPSIPPRKTGNTPATPGQGMLGTGQIVLATIAGGLDTSQDSAQRR